MAEASMVAAGSQRVLSTSRDDTLRVWEGKKGLAEAVSIKHYNNTGRWVSPFRSVWGPAGDTIICGSMKRNVSACSAPLARKIVNTSVLAKRITLMHRLALPPSPPFPSPSPPQAEGGGGERGALLLARLSSQNL